MGALGRRGLSLGLRAFVAVGLVVFLGSLVFFFLNFAFKRLGVGLRMSFGSWTCKEAVVVSDLGG